MAQDPPRARAHLGLDPRALEARFLEALRRARPAAGAPIPRIAVVAPTRRLLDRLAQVATAESGALAGVRFLVHRGLARHILAEAGDPPARTIRTPLLAALLRPRLASADRSLSPYLAAHGAELGPLLATFRDLRDAGVDAEAAGAGVRLSAIARSTFALYREFEALLRDVAAAGFEDGAAAPRRASARLASGGAPFDALLHYGAYDLIGVHRDLVAALAARVPAELFVPAAAGHELPARLVRALGADVATNAGSAPPPEAHPLVSAAGPREEIRLAVRRLLDWHERDGVPFAEMAILARSPASHADALAAEAALLDLVPDTSFDRPLAAAPRARELARLLRSWRTPPRRRPPAASPLLRLPRDESDREARFRAAGSASERLDLVRELVDAPEEPALAERLATAASDLRRLEAAAGAARGIELDAAAIVDLLVREPAPVDARRVGALRLLDFQQARALPLRRAVLIGANERWLPRRPREDFFLPDEDRRALAEATGRPIPLKREARAEEELLLEIVRGAVAERLEISFARAIDDRDEAASPWLGRLTATPVEQARIVPRHPTRELDVILETTGVLSGGEALVAAARVSGASALELAAALDDPRRDALARGLAMMAVVDDYGRASLRFDGDVGPLAEEPHFSPTRLQDFGRCPLRYFFRHELGLQAEEEPPPSGELDRRTRGRLLHDVMEALYRELLPPGRPLAADAPARAQQLLPRLVDAALDRAAQDGALAPALRPIRSASISRSLLAFVRGDLEHVAANGLVGGDYELEDSVSLGTAGDRREVSLRFDRILRDAKGREWIADYKSGGVDTLRRAARTVNALAGRELQMPVYLLAREARDREVAALELLAIDEGDDTRSKRRFACRLDELQDARERLLEVLAGLAALRAAGRFPLQPEDDLDRGQCGRCEFRLACRHAHGATRARARAAPEFAGYFAIAAAASAEAEQDEEAP